MSRNRLITLVSIAFLLVSSLGGCTSTTNVADSSSTEVPTLDIQDNIVSALGEVVPEQWANLAFATGGYDLDIQVTPGESVNSGMVLARVNDVAQQAAIANARSAVGSALANLQRLEDIDARESDIDVAQKAVAAAQAGLEQAQESLDATILRAPFKGVIVDVFLRDYETAAPNQPVILLANLTAFVIQTTDLSEVDVARVQINDPTKVVFDALPEVTATGKVIRIALRPEPGAGVYYTVTIQLEEIPENLRWGMSAFVEIKVSK